MRNRKLTENALSFVTKDSAFPILLLCASDLLADVLKIRQISHNFKFCVLICRKGI